MNDQLLAILAHARIEAMLREAASFRLLVELRPVPPVQPPLATVRRAFAAVLHRAANAIAVEA